MSSSPTQPCRLPCHGPRRSHRGKFETASQRSPKPRSSLPASVSENESPARWRHGRARGIERIGLTLSDLPGGEHIDPQEPSDGSRSSRRDLQRSAVSARAVLQVVWACCCGGEDRTRLGDIEPILGTTQVGAGEIRAGQCRIHQLRSTQMRSNEIGASQIRTRQIRTRTDEEPMHDSPVGRKAQRSRGDAA